MQKSGFEIAHYHFRSTDSAVGIETGYGLDDLWVGVLGPVGSRIFPSPRRSNQPCQSQSQSQSHITIDNQSASPSWCQAPIWDPRPMFLSP
jgi:hypothetical protein